MAAPRPTAADIAPRGFEQPAKSGEKQGFPGQAAQNPAQSQYSGGILPPDPAAVKDAVAAPAPHQDVPTEHTELTSASTSPDLRPETLPAGTRANRCPDLDQLGKLLQFVAPEGRADFLRALADVLESERGQA